MATIPSELHSQYCHVVHTLKGLQQWNDHVYRWQHLPQSFRPQCCHCRACPQGDKQMHAEAELERRKLVYDRVLCSKSVLFKLVALHLPACCFAAGSAQWLTMIHEAVLLQPCCSLCLRKKECNLHICLVYSVQFLTPAQGEQPVTSSHSDTAINTLEYIESWFIVR